ncbi:MAG: GAF domain-containing protein [Gemmatimonadaceae bacterium]
MSNEARPDTENTEALRDKVKRALRTRARIEALRRTGLAESAAQRHPAFERAARIAASALAAPVSQVNLLSDDTQLPLAVHADRPGDADMWRAPRQAGSSYCKYVIWTKQPFVVEDARAHNLVRHGNATRELSIGAYLGVPIRAPSDGDEPGHVVGSLCVIDHVPRQWTSRDVEVLLDLADAVSEELEHRMQLKAEKGNAARQAARVLENLGVPVLTTDAQGVTTYANPAAVKLLGYSAEELVGHDQHALIHHSHADGSRYNESECPNYIARQEGHSLRATNDTFWKNDGTAVTVDSLMTPLFTRGAVSGTVLTFTDVSERYAAEVAERLGRVAAETANRAKSEMLIEMSRELRLPLGALDEHLAQVDAQLTTSASSDLRSELASMHRSVRHLIGLVDNISGFATIDDHAEALG